MKKTLMWGGIIASALLFVAIFGGPSKPKPDPADAIEAACQDQFGARGPLAVAQCRAEITSKRLIEAERDKMSRADRQSR